MSVAEADLNFLETFASISPFDIPNANEENKELQRQLKEKLAIAELLRERVAKFDEKTKVVSQHLRNVQDDRAAIEALITSKEKELETEYLAVRNAESEICKFRRHIVDLEKEDLDLHEKCAETKEKIAAYAIRIAKIRTELHWDEETYKAWSQKLAKKNEDNFTLLKYAEIDEIRIKDLTMKLEKLSTETEECRNRVEKATAERNACEARLKKSTRELAAVQKQKSDLAAKWEEVVQKISERDAESQDLLRQTEKAEEDLREALERKDVEEATLEREKLNVKEMAYAVAELEARNCMLKSQLESATQQRDYATKELDSLQMNLDRDRRELEKVRSRNKDAERTIMQKSMDAEKLAHEIDDLETKQKDSSEHAFSVAQKAQMVKDLLEESESYRNSLIEKVERLTQAKAKRTNELNDLQRTVQNLRNQISAVKKEIKRIEATNKETEESIRSKEESGYKLDVKIVKLEKEIAAYVGQKSPGSAESLICKELKEAKSGLEKDLEKLRRDNFDLETENQRACEQLKRARTNYNKATQEKDRAEEKLRDLDIEVSKASKQYKELKAEKENILVERNLLQVDVHKHVKKLRSCATSFSELKKDQVETERLCKEEEEEKKAELEMIKCQAKVLEEDRQHLQMSLNEKTDKADKSKKRYETILEAIGGKVKPSSVTEAQAVVGATKPTGNHVGKANKKKLAMLAPDSISGEDAGLKSASYFIVRRAQEKQELEQKIAEMEAKVSENRAELEACERTLALVRGNNALFRKQTVDATVRGAETDEDGLKKLQAEEEYESARIELNMKTLELNEAKITFEAQEAHVEKLKSEIEASGKEIEELEDRKAQLEKEVSDQVRRLQIVTNRVNRLIKELKTQDKLRGGSGTEFAELQRDLELKKLKEKNKKVMKSLRELAQTDIAIWASVERAFLENDLPLSYLSTPLDTTSSSSSTAEGFSKREGAKPRDQRKSSKSGTRQRAPAPGTRTESLLASSDAGSFDSRASAAARAPSRSTDKGTSKGSLSDSFKLSDAGDDQDSTA